MGERTHQGLFCETVSSIPSITKDGGICTSRRDGPHEPTDAAYMPNPTLHPARHPLLTNNRETGSGDRLHGGIQIQVALLHDP